MNYELANELKHAGFKYSREIHEAYKLDGSKMLVGDDNTQPMVFIPSLEELIEACGEPIRLYIMTNKCSAILDGPNLGGEGATPTEAVARLWLALKLNKKV